MQILFQLFVENWCGCILFLVMVTGRPGTIQQWQGLHFVVQTVSIHVPGLGSTPSNNSIFTI